VSIPRDFRLLVYIVLVFLSSKPVFAAAYCSADSAIDQVPFFVGQTFLDILNRTPGGEGQTFWISKLEGLNASTCRSARPAFSAGGCEWNNDAQITLEILSSPESVSKNGNLTSNSAFVNALYQLLLRRAPEAEGLKSHMSSLNSGASRVSVVASFLSSPEYRHRFACMANGTSNPSCRGAEVVDPIPAFVSQTSQDILGHSLDGASQASWTSRVTSNQSAMCKNPSATAFSACDYVIEAQTIMEFFDGSAYRNSNPPIADNKAFAIALYQHLLHRAPDPGGLQFHVNYLNETNDRLGTIYAFLTANEYRQRFTCYAGSRDRANLGFTGHPLTQAVYSDSGGVSFDQQVTLVKDAGAEWYRFDVNAPSTGMDFTKMDLLVSRAQAHGVQLLPILMPVIDRQHDDLATIYRKSHDAAFNFVNRYKTSIHVWELSNEQDVYSIHKTGDPGWSQPTPNGDQLTDYDLHRYAIAVALLRGLADGVRAADSNALRVINFGGWLHTAFLQKIENDAIPYEIAGLHWYQGMGEMTCPGHPAPCPTNPQHPSVIQLMQTITHDKPVWVTETNYTPLSSNSVQANIAMKENYLVSSLQKYLSSPAAYPFQTIFVYELLDEPNLPSDVTQTQMGAFSVTPSAGGGYALGSAKPEYRSLKGLFGR